jgi:hypothetical protein
MGAGGVTAPEPSIEVFLLLFLQKKKGSPLLISPRALCAQMSKPPSRESAMM